MATIVLTGLLSGCGTYLYSKTRDDQAAAAKTAWKAVDTTAFFDGERQRLDALLKQELDNQSRIGINNRDAKLQLMVSRPLTESIEQPLTTDLQRLLGTPPHDLKALDAAIKQYSEWRKALKAPDSNRFAFVRDLFEVKGLPLPSCSEAAKGGEPKSIGAWRTRTMPTQEDEAWVSSALKQLAQACSEIPQATAPTQGTLAELWGKYEAEQERYAILKAEASTQQKAYEKAKEAYITATNGSDKTKTEEELGKLNAAIKKLQDASKDNALVAQFLSEEQAKSLQEHLTALTYDPNKPVTKGAGQVGALLALIPEAAANTRKQIQEGEKAAQTPLLIERNSYELKAAAAAKDVKAQEAVVSLSKEIFEAEAGRADRLLAIKEQLTGIDPTYLGMSLTGAEESALRIVTSGKDGKTVQRAREQYQTLEGLMVSYLDTTGMETKRRNLEYQRWAAFHQRSVAYSQDNVAQWQASINAMLDQLAAYHKDGWTVDDVLKPLNAATLLWIGVGVN